MQFGVGAGGLGAAGGLGDPGGELSPDCKEKGSGLTQGINIEGTHCHLDVDYRPEARVVVEVEIRSSPRLDKPNSVYCEPQPMSCMHCHPMNDVDPLLASIQGAVLTGRWFASLVRRTVKRDRLAPSGSLHLRP